MNYTGQDVLDAMEQLPTLWIKKHNIKNEMGIPITFGNHPFMWDIYNDLSPYQVQLKAPQIGATLMNAIKAFFVAKKQEKDVIYTLPTDGDVTSIVGGKINRLIAQNPILMQWVKDHDTIEQKGVGKQIVYFRGTFAKKQAMMVTSQQNIHDEVDASNADVITQYETRLQADGGGAGRWYFSHPTLKGFGVDVYWEQSDKKMWFIPCPHCKEEQVLLFPENFDLEAKTYICRFCKGILSDDDRRNGAWFATQTPDEKHYFSGYWISQMICPWISAAKIIKDYNDPQKDEQYFYNNVLGLPYTGSGDKVYEEDILGACSDEVNNQEGRIIIGVDPGLPIWYVMGNKDGIFYYGNCEAYDELEGLMRRYPQAIIVSDQGGDLIGMRQLQGKFPGRVFLVYYQTDRKSQEMVDWGVEKEYGTVKADRYRTMQLMIDYFKKQRVVLNGTKEEWYNYWLHFNNITRKVKVNGLGVPTAQWERNGPDHLVHASNYFFIGFSHFGGEMAGFVSPGVSFTEGQTKDHGMAFRLGDNYSPFDNI